ncbi:MAG: aminotransferase class IV [Phycisphaeraceae bacterium]|nr:aminotransferase class IV [Phycisphaeraceae bacterium]
MKTYLNGQMLDDSQALVSTQDAGFQHAVGLFETMFARNGKVFRLDRHLARLKQSAAELGLAAEMDTTPLADAVQQTLTENKLEQARLRLTVTAGTLSMLRSADGDEALKVIQTVCVQASEPTAFAPGYFEQGVRARLYGQGANPFDITAGHKTLNYWARLRSLRQAAASDCAEAIWLSVTNHLASGAVSNLFLVKDGGLFTPIARGEEKPEALPAPVLPGITRQAVIEAAEAQGLTVKKQMLSVEDLLEADEVFLTNSNWKVLPVVAVEQKDIADGKVGEMTLSLRQRILAMVEEETSSK